jgi:mannitol/fructose-specific phosphotransferase system IIA component (Ntr-type)
MNKYINQLLQMQDLEIAMREHKSMKGKEEEETCSELRKNILGLKKLLPPDISIVYDRISKKYDIYVCPMVNSACTSCFMKIPVGFANSVLSTSNCISCPTCGRFLYFDEGHFARPSDEFHQYKGVARFSSQDLMLPQIKAKTKEEVIEKIALRCCETGFVENHGTFLKALIKREALITTAVGSGIVFPHARAIKACGLTLAVGTVKPGIKESEEPLSIFFVSAVPTQTSIFYIELISKLANYFSKAENRKKILDCTKPEEMWKIMVQIGK